jgi:hypothetical protein
MSAIVVAERVTQLGPEARGARRNRDPNQGARRGVGTSLSHGFH